MRSPSESYHDQLIREFEETRKMDCLLPLQSLQEIAMKCSTLKPADPDLATLADIVQVLIEHVKRTQSSIPEVPRVRVEYER